MSPFTQVLDVKLTDRDRTSVVLRPFYALPASIYLSFYAGLGFAGAMFAWLWILLTGRYPAEVYAFNVKVVRMLGRYFSYLLIAHDVSPPLDGDPSDAYPLRVELPPPPAHYDRRAIALRPFTGIPVLIRGVITYVIGHLYAIVGTLVILVTGELPASVARPLRDAVAELTRMHAHVLLMTDEPLALPPSQAEPARAIGG